MKNDESDHNQFLGTRSWFLNIIYEFFRSSSKLLLNFCIDFYLK